MKLCIVSDSHDDGAGLAQAVATARDEGAEAVIHCGDVIGTHTLRAAMKAGLPLHVVHGNNLGDPAALYRNAAKSNGQLTYYGMDGEVTLGGRKIFFVHYPHYGEAMALTARYDLVCCGHSHEVHVSQVTNIAGGKTWLVNPGTTAGLGMPRTWVMADLAELSFDVRTLD